MDHNDDIKNELAYALTDKDLITLYDGNFVIYNDIDKYNNIDDLFKNDVCFILFEMARKNNGHYCVLTKRGNMVEFFDSYGVPIEQQKKFISNPDLFQAENHIIKMIKESPYKLSYNDHFFQDNDYDNISTCGRWCAMRAIYKDIPLSKFKNMIIKECTKHKIMPDDYVTYRTMPLIGK